MPAYYTFEKDIPHYMKLVDELWYAAGGITPMTKTTLNVARGMFEPPKSLRNAFLYAMKMEKHWDAAMIFEDLIYFTNMATYVDHQITKNFRAKSFGPAILYPLMDATEKAYDMVIYSMYPPSRVGFGGAVDSWYTIKSPRPSKILYPTEINGKTIEEMRQRLWTIVSQTGADYAGKMTATEYMKSLVNRAIVNAESADKEVRRGNFIGASTLLTEAVFVLSLYFRHRQSIQGKMGSHMREFDEIDVELMNAFNSHCNNIKESIGL